MTVDEFVETKVVPEFQPVVAGFMRGVAFEDKYGLRGTSR